MVMFQREGAKAVQQTPIVVRFLGEVVDYFADILLEGRFILAPKSIEKIINVHRAQSLNYLKATGLHLAIILNFG
jgi:GxxExxY protein